MLAPFGRQNLGHARHKSMAIFLGGTPTWGGIGTILTAAELDADEAETDHCGSCRACLDICPTAAFPAPYRLDARRCISYLTIELPGAIPEALRAPMGNRIYGCDDCQLVCPWNKYARDAAHPDFRVRHALDAPRLSELFSWSAAQFKARMSGSAIYRIGHERWLRNVAVALGNALAAVSSDDQAQPLLAALQQHADSPSLLVQEHAQWALAQWSVRG